MATLESLQKKIKTTSDLRSIVSTMKSLSSVSILQYEQAIISLDSYFHNILDGFHALVKYRPIPEKEPHKSGKTLAIIIGSDNGLVGRFNKDVVNYSLHDLKENHIPLEDVLFLTVGKRVAVLAENEGVHFLAKYAISNSIKVVNSLAGTIIIRIYEAMQKQKVSQVEVFYHQRKQSSSVELKKITLLPFSAEQFKNLKNKPWDTNSVPLMTLPVKALSQALLKEYLMIELSRALTYSLAAEHHTRMINMQNAEKNIDESLFRLNQEYQQKRQDVITEELIDVVSGSEAIHRKK